MANSIVILHGGQTGVDRGAHWGALDTGLPIAGWMPKAECDETGPIPEHVKLYLTRCTVGARDSGYAARTGANVERSNAVLLVVQDHRRIGATRGTALTHSIANDDRFGRPWLAIDPDTPIATVTTWVKQRLQELSDQGEFELRLLVAGPRASSWAAGERVARTFVAAIGGHDVRCFVPAGGGLADEPEPAFSGPSFDED